MGHQQTFFNFDAKPKLSRREQLIGHDEAFVLSAKSANDSRYCTVRMLANLSGMTYHEASRHMKKHGRVHGRGMYTSDYMRAVKEVLELGDAVKKPELRKMGVLTTKSLKRNMPEGKWIVQVSGHVYAVIDGIVLDWADQAGEGQPNHGINWMTPVLGLK